MTYEKIGLNINNGREIIEDDSTFDTYIKMFFPYVTTSRNEEDTPYTTKTYYLDEEKTKVGLYAKGCGSSRYTDSRQLTFRIYGRLGNSYITHLFDARYYGYLYVTKDDENNVISITLLDVNKYPILIAYKDTNDNVCTILCTETGASGVATFGVYLGAYDSLGSANVPFAVHANKVRGQAVSLAKLPTNDTNNSRAINIFLTPFTPYYPSSSGGLIMDTYKINDSTYLMNQIMAVQLT